MSVDELKQKLSNPATATEWMSKLSRYVANVPGTTPYWKQKRNQLKALDENLGEAHVFLHNEYGRQLLVGPAQDSWNF